MKASVKKQLLNLSDRLGVLKEEVQTLLNDEEAYAADLESESKIEASESLQESYGELLELLETANSAIADMVTD
jgi:hypothetical protein